MPSGSCLCGGLKINYSGEPAIKALCHCIDCRKISGSTASTNVLVPQEGFTATGKSATYEKTADSGNSIVSYFCPTCGTTVYRGGGSFPGLWVVKAGVLDGDMSDAQPKAELYVSRRAPWLGKINGTDQFETMPPS